MKTASYAAGLAMLLMSASTLAAHSPAASTGKMTVKQQCEDLAKQFYATDPGHVEALKLENAKKRARLGESLCSTDPRGGIRSLHMAFKGIGVAPQ